MYTGYKLQTYDYEIIHQLRSVGWSNIFLLFLTCRQGEKTQLLEQMSLLRREAPWRAVERGFMRNSNLSVWYIYIYINYIYIYIQKGYVISRFFPHKSLVLIGWLSQVMLNPHLFVGTIAILMISIAILIDQLLFTRKLIYFEG